MQPYIRTFPFWSTLKASLTFKTFFIHNIEAKEKRAILMILGCGKKM